MKPFYFNVTKNWWNDYTGSQDHRIEKHIESDGTVRYKVRQYDALDRHIGTVTVVTKDIEIIRKMFDLDQNKLNEWLNQND